MKTTKKIALLGTSFILLGGLISGAAIEIGSHTEHVLAAPTRSYVVEDPSVYYKDIDSSLEGDSLLTALRTLNLSKRKSTVGYSSMGTTPSGQFKYTDYDPNFTQKDSNGQVYGTKILSFYSGESTTSWNREHVWPNSRGGGSGGNAGSPYPDADIYMPRPTIQAENSDRGNSKYVEGMAHSSNGWDPVTAFASTLGVYNSIRGECARIVFYCMTVNSKLVLDDTATGGTTGVTMGKISDLLKWNLDNPVNEREVNRQSGGQYLQGNRNAFVDHPEYACKIWGNYNSATRQICGSQKEVTKITLNTNTVSLAPNQTEQLTVTATYSDGTSANVTSSSSFSSSNTSVATVSNSGLITGVSTSGYTNINVSYSGKSTVCQVYGTTPTPTNLSGISADPITLGIGSTASISVTLNPSNTYPLPTYTYKSNDTTIATVNSSGVVTGVKDGSTTITVTATQNTIIKTATCNVEVSSDPLSGTWKLASSVSVGDKIILTNQSKLASAGTVESSVLKSLSDLTFNSDKSELDSIPEGTEVFTVGGSSGSYTLTDQDGKLLGCTAEKKLNLDGDGTTTWSITFSGSNPTITSSSTYGSLQYNTGAPRFTTYKSSQGPVHIYKKNASSDYVTLNKSTLSLDEGNTETLVATASGEVSWSSSNTSVATVNNGKVTAVSSGYAVITASCGGASANCSVTVIGKPISVTSVSLNQTSISISSGTQETLVPTISPSDATNKNVSWSSSNTDVATVSNGVVSGKQVGTATITVITEDGNKTATCVVTVTAPLISNSIKECYSKSKGATVTDVYGLFVGTINNNESSIIMNGEYGILLYKTYVSSWVENQTYVKINTAYLNEYKGLYELQNAATATGNVSYTVITDQSVIDANITPVVTYKVTGNETSSDTELASRLCLITGTVTSGSVTVGKDSTLTVSINGKSVTLFVKKASATQEVKNFFDKGGELTVKGFTSFYTNFQVIFKSTVEYSDDYFASDFAQDLLNLTSSICASSQSSGWSDVKAQLSTIWITLEGSEYYAKLPTDQKTILVQSSAIEGGTTIEDAMARYDHIIGRYGLTNFISRNVSYSKVNVFISESGKTMSLVAIVSLVGLSVIGGYFFYKKRKEHF